MKDMSPDERLMNAIFGSPLVLREEVEGVTLHVQIQKVLATLEYTGLPLFNIRILTIIRKRYGYDGKPETFVEIGRHFDRTPARMRDILQKALRLLRSPSRTKHLTPYIVEEK